MKGLTPLATLLGQRYPTEGAGNQSIAGLGNRPKCLRRGCGAIKGPGLPFIVWHKAASGFCILEVS
jgi:hypothetical protein